MYYDNNVLIYECEQFLIISGTYKIKIVDILFWLSILYKNKKLIEYNCYNIIRFLLN